MASSHPSRDADARHRAAPSVSSRWPFLWVAHGGWLFMIGDGADPKRIYESADGIHWLAYEHDAEWGMRYRAADASFRGAPWRVSGFVQAADRHVLVSDVWRSVDGRRWTRLLTRAPWSPRHGAHLVVLRDSLWLVGGEPNDRRLWFTTDGHAWGSRPATGLPASDPQAVIAHRGLLWILGHGVWEPPPTTSGRPPTA